MLRKINLTNFFAVLLIGGLGLGILSNVIFPQNPKLSCLVLAIAAGLWFIKPYFKKWTDRFSPQTIKWAFVGTMGIILLVQLLILHFLPATVYHDPYRVLNQAELLSRGHLTWTHSIYFYRSPNNAPLAILLSYWIKLFAMIHLSTFVAVHFLSILLLDGLIALIISLVRQYTTRNYSVLATMLFFIFSSFAYTYYLQVFYSDLPILFTLALVFFVVARWTHLSTLKKIVLGAAIFLAVMLGQIVKPNLIVLAVAIVLVGGWLLIRQRKQFVKLLVPFVLMLGGFAASVPVTHVMEQTSHFSESTKYEIPTTHWIEMGYNPNTYGRISGADVKKLDALPTKAARQAYLNKAFPARLKKLGIVGIVKQWAVKLGILLNVGNVQAAYTGGFIQAPASYQKIAAPVKTLSSALMRASIILLYVEVLLSSVALIRRQATLPNTAFVLALVTAVGYLAFHTLLWETESRYGQALIPMLFLLSTVKRPAIKSLTPKTTRFRVFSTVAFLAVVAAAYITSPLTLIDNIQLVSGQLGQLSIQYKALLTAVKPHQAVTQELQLNHSASRFIVSTAPKAHLTGQLINLKTKHAYQLAAGPKSLLVHHVLAKGKYIIKISNNTTKTQKLQISRMYDYKLAPYPVKLNNQLHPSWSLIYQATRAVKI
ncbi:hypothetical protein AYR62_15465 [Secundilactobacillus paracollinoides]|uniref:hypothetical protein n=1 Tax=Secundilactobacillus paracollinoides TaxID=240427 RepID=UPI00081A4F08|nr:hypothetical protein [Secundilactobacillus paracollinoides]ANZ65336.1 hypothetical protein AYR62_15465 [Secundilactobacillus paracollinoides]